MSSRVTRSSARLAAESSAATSSPGALPAPPPAPNHPPANSRKRKATGSAARTSSHFPAEPANSPPRRSKRQKVTATEQLSVSSPAPLDRRRSTNKSAQMAKPGSSSTADGTADSNHITPTGTESSKRKSSRNKKPVPEIDPSATPPTSSTRRSKRNSAKKTEDVLMKDQEETPKGNPKSSSGRPSGGEPSDEDEQESPRRPFHQEDDDDDPFRSSFLSHSGHPGGLSSTLRALSGMVTGSSSKLREILPNLREKDDPSVQLIALQDLSELLLVSTEDNLSGQFSPDHFVKELVTLMQPSELGEENPEMMLLACRCIANLMEALPSSTANVVYGGAVPVLCQKLLEIHYIDVAEQALSTLEKISVEFPSSVVREGGLTACLTYLDFFATPTQRSAVTTAANCCRNIPQDSFAVVRDVMPILLNVLSSSDQKVVEQGSLCVSRIIESFKHQQDKLEELVSADLLKAIRGLLLPGTTNMIGPNIHTQFLRVLAIAARASPLLSVEMFTMSIVDTLFQILTGVSPPDAVEDAASKIDSVVIMQALIHRPREHVFETLNVICELLPGVDTSALSFQDDCLGAGSLTEERVPGRNPGSQKSPNAKRVELLRECKDEVKRFAIILLPTLTDAYTSTVNLSVRQKVLTAHLKMLSNLDASILEDALRMVPYASHLTSILSQQDHPTLVTFALQAAEFLLIRLPSIYRYQFYREGVMAEIIKLASQPAKAIEEKPKVSEKPQNIDESNGVEKVSAKIPPQPRSPREIQPDPSVSSDDESDEDDDGDQDNEDDENNEDDEEGAEVQDDMSLSDSSSSDQNEQAPVEDTTLQDTVKMRAKSLLAAHDTAKATEMRDKASKIMDELKTVAKGIKACYSSQGSGSGIGVFSRLSRNFHGDALSSITSAELLNSGIVQVLLDAFSNSDGSLTALTLCSADSADKRVDFLQANARMDFLQVFLKTQVRSGSSMGSSSSSTTAFSVLVHKLQDLLSRSEHFEVLTVHQNAAESNRNSAASMLAKQLRLRLVAEDETEMPRPYKNLMISIHAIATFKALDDYLRPRISLSERPKSSRHREGISHSLASFAAASEVPSPRPRLSDRGDSSNENPAVPFTPSSTATASRSSKKVMKSKNPATTSENTPARTTTPTVRRSSRRHQPNKNTSAETPVQSSEEIKSPLECADERQLSDDEDGEDSNALDAIVDDLDDGMEDDQLPDPTAVNMEVASTGKVTARKEDGTRVGTPSQASTTMSGGPSSSLSRELLAAGINPSIAGRAMSYAAAIQAVPQDWHIGFSIDGKPIRHDTTIYRAIHDHGPGGADPPTRNVWSDIHSIQFKRVQGPPPPEHAALASASGSMQDLASESMPNSLQVHPATSTILRLLNILHEFNANLDDVVDESKEPISLNVEPLSQFVNTKLTAKLNRQLEEPLIVASKCLPSWSEDLARLYPFLFPFETRHLFLQSTSFGYSRSMTRWQNAQSTDDSRRDRHRDDRPFMGRLQRQKVRISRTRILESALKVMELYGASSSVLEVEYFEEVGTGLGPTLEFYATVSREFSKKKTKMWREGEANDLDEFAFGKLGMFPAPMSAQQADSENGKKILHLFKMLGKFIARAMLDSRIIDVSLNPTFFRIGDQPSTVPLSLGAVKTVDSQLAQSLKLVKQYANEKKRIEEDKAMSASSKTRAIQQIAVRGVTIDHLGLDFTLPGYPSIELAGGGHDKAVTIENVGEYVEKVIDMTLGSGVQRQVDAFRAGFSQVFSYTALKAFTPGELVMLFGRVEEDWSIETLLDSIKADHGFNMDSRSVRNLLQVMSELTVQQRRDFLQFVTGSPKLPIGGFKSLTPMFTVVCKPSEPPYTSDDFLISVMTCANYVKLPDYSSIDTLRRRLLTAIQEGQGAFHLS
ncbi:MAG: hypothetical protein LQ341_003143 [Variospora aurantia]|nr:MAG: hypothetical protein LQ341_003143 [Variospora aurantia]